MVNPPYFCVSVQEDLLLSNYHSIQETESSKTEVGNSMEEIA
jgi:hypothetical protein